MRRSLSFKAISLVLCAQLWSWGQAHACTVFAVLPQTHTYSLGGAGERPSAFTLGKNFEFIFGDGFVAWNPPGLSKRAHIFEKGAAPLEWTSLYENLTLNQFGLNLPVGGMNILGLVVEGQILDSTQYPESSNGLPSINELQVIQYLLDTAGSVGEAVNRLRDLRIVPIARGLHWFIADRSGTCVVAEFSEGRLLLHDTGLHPFRALANAPYRLSVRAREKQLVGSKPSQMDIQICSYERAVRVHERLVQKVSFPAISDFAQFSFSILEDVVQARLLRWSVVYDVPNRRVHLRAPLKSGGSVDTTIDLPLLEMAMSPQIWRFEPVEGRPLTSRDFISDPAQVQAYHCARVMSSKRPFKLSDEILEVYKKFPHGVELSPES